MKRVKDNGVEIIPEPKPSNHWMRNKKPSLDFLHDTPFAADRQLEDQRYLNELNRNPRLHEFTRMDKLRSVNIAKTKGQSRSVAIKANVINKVVREATGIHNYTIVPPPKLDDAASIAGKQPLEPETNPLVRAYAQESKSKPIICSFGHRPKSASRTFHPATMKFRLKSGQILPSVADGKTGVGLPVAVLKKVLHAPKIQHNFAEESVEGDNNFESSHSDLFRSPLKSTSAPSGTENKTTSNWQSDLFLSKADQDSLFASNNVKRPIGKLEPIDGESNASWISSIEQRQRLKKAQAQKADRPGWDEGFHRITLKAKDRFDQKKSLLNPKSDKPLSELLHRFDARSVAENQPTIFCSDKQELDKLERGGHHQPVPKSVPVKGRPLYSDPWDIQVQQIKMLRQVDENERMEKINSKSFQDKLKTIPKVDYYPTSILKSMQSKSTISLEVSQITQEESDDLAEATAGHLVDSPMKKTSPLHGTSTMDALAQKYPHWENTETEMKLAMTLAKRGDRRALYDFHLRSSSYDNRALPSAWRTDHNTTHSSIDDGMNTNEYEEGDWLHTSHSAMSALSDSQTMQERDGSLQENNHQDHENERYAEEEGEESTLIGEKIDLRENSQIDNDTLTFSRLDQQRKDLNSWDLDHEQLLNENTIE